MRSKAVRSTTRSLMTGKALARHGSIDIVSPSLNRRMWSWQTVVPRSGPCAMPLTTQAARPADAFPAVGVEGDGILALLHQPLVDDVEHFEKRHVRGHVLRHVVDEPPGRLRPPLSPDLQVQSSFVAPLCGVHLVERQRFLVQLGLLPDALKFPRRHVRRSLRRHAGPRRRASGSPRGSGRRTTPSRCSASSASSSANSR